MKLPASLMLVLACGLTLAACNQAAPEKERALTAPMQSAEMQDMAAVADTKTVKGSGTVTAIDAAAGKISLAHEPIPEAGWPAMTMAFDAKPEVLTGVTVGDKVAFDLELKGGAGEVKAVEKQ